MKKIIIGLVALVVLGGTIALAASWSNRVTHLEPPLLKANKAEVGEKMILTGIAYPNAKLAVYVDGQFVQDIPVSSDGSFQGNVSFDIEGERQVTAKQLYKNITSDFSSPVAVAVDLTPPDKNSFTLTSTIPSFSKETSLTITGTAEVDSKILVNGKSYPVSADGSFEGAVDLKNGDNTLTFSLSDEVGNTVDLESHTVTVDAIPPKVSTTFCGAKPDPSNNYTSIAVRDLRDGEEFVCISTGQWEDWRDPAPIPIVGYVYHGEVASITVDGKSVYPDENDEIYQRVYLSVPKGLNKYKVVVTDTHGNQTSASLSMTVQSVREGDYDDVIDRLDDIEGQIDGLY